MDPTHGHRDQAHSWKNYMDRFAINSDTAHDPRFLARLRVAVKERSVFLLRNVLRWIALSRRRRHSSASGRSDDKKPLRHEDCSADSFADGLVTVKIEGDKKDESVVEEPVQKESLVEDVEVPFVDVMSTMKCEDKMGTSSAAIINANNEAWQRSTREHLLNMFNYDISHADLFDKLTHWDNTEVSFKENQHQNDVQGRL